ncbi:GrpB family protein [Lewinella sp. W8]|uniref:GrpB family protein n=1 Tax=Lewinella sp. W8 TaxID=2528208 RepID=UPI0010680C0A|nr:GrpB family protein [Lewinella sp. W8]MTB52032.1 hypothetical protein [Lewinella sp. W8]
MNFRRYIPMSLKVRYQLLRRSWRDWRSGLRHQFARAEGGALTDLPHRISLRQAVMPSATLAAKRHNFRLAIGRITPVRVRPGEVFSFWRAVGAPTRANGFREGRTIIDGKLQASFGGGLCQLSGLLYAVSLRAGLEVVERHNHSVDIYTEATRYAPLGADATVAYGYKDLRLRNNAAGLITFRFTLEDHSISVHLDSEVPIRERTVTHVVNPSPDATVTVATFLDGQQTTTSRYRKLEEEAAIPPLIQDYDPKWVGQFDTIREVLQAALAGLSVEIEHVGSTAVPGLAAKSIIDIDMIYPPTLPLEEITQRLASIGYRHHGDQGIAEREVYKRVPGSDHPVLDHIRHHLYACPQGSAELHRHLTFRDQLRAHAHHREAYQRIKRELAREAGQDKKAYARLKQLRATDFVQRVLREADT